MIIRQNTSSKVFELFLSCCTLSHKELYCGQVFTSSYLVCLLFYHQMCMLQLSKSHKTGLSHLSDPETPTLIISTWLNLAFKVDEPNSLELFDHLSALVGTGIIKGTNTKHRSYEGHIGRITQPVENTWHSYGQFSQGTFYLSDSMSRNQLSQKFSRSYLNSRI